jgi:hypothetical protein
MNVMIWSYGFFWYGVGGTKCMHPPDALMSCVGAGALNNILGFGIPFR